MTLGKSNCPICPDFATCDAPCSWFIGPTDDSPGGCVVVLLYQELLALRRLSRARPGKKAQAPGERSGPPWQQAK